MIDLIPRIIAIGMDRSGGPEIAAYFQAAGAKVVSGLTRPVALDITLSLRNGQDPLSKWPKGKVFVDLYSDTNPRLPILYGFAHFEFLAQRLPDAVFLLNRRAKADWLAARHAARNGQFAGGQVNAALGNQTEQLEQWSKEWDAHHKAVRGTFGQQDRLIDLDMDGDWQTQLAGDLELLYAFPPPHAAPLPKPAAILAAPVRTASRLKGTKAQMAQAIAEFSLGKRDLQITRYVPPNAHQWAQWDGVSRVKHLTGSDYPISPLTDRPSDGFVPDDTPDHRANRILAHLNEMRHWLRPGVPVTSDLRDARGYGQGQKNPPFPLFTYNRKPRARNCVLWPLGGYHTPYTDHYVSVEPRDTIPFQDKIDQCVWRGNLTGLSVKALTPPDVARSGGQRLMNALGKPTLTESEWELLRSQLNTLTRFNLTHRLRASPDFDFALVLPPVRKGLANVPGFGRYLGKPRPVPWFYRYKYIASLSGHDTGSNFLMGVNSNSLVFKEDEDWELFYSDLYKPWQHYVPIAKGGTDIEDKLEWARSHPDKALDITKAARAVSAQLADLRVRHAFLGDIAETALG